VTSHLHFLGVLWHHLGLECTVVQAFV